MNSLYECMPKSRDRARPSAFSVPCTLAIDLAFIGLQLGQTAGLASDPGIVRNDLLDRPVSDTRYPGSSLCQLPLRRLLAPLSHLAHALAFCVPPQAAALAATMRAMLHPSAPAASSSGGNGATSASMSQPRGRRSRHSRRRAGGSGGGGGGMDDVDLLDDRGWMDLAAATGDPRDVGESLQHCPTCIQCVHPPVPHPATLVSLTCTIELAAA